MRFKSEKGSITVFVLIALLFMSSFLLILYGSNVNKSKTVKEQFGIIKNIYSTNDNINESYTEAYTDIRKKNIRTFSFKNEKDADKTIFRNTKTVELTKTITGNISDYRIYGKTINLFDAYNRTAGVLDNTSSKRNFDTTKYYIGLTMNNYYSPNSVISAKLENNVWKIAAKSYGYGVGFPINCKPNTIYYLSGETDGPIGIGFYDSEGNFLSYNTNTNVNRTLTTPDNCYILTIVFRPDPDTEINYSNFQLSETSEAIEYQPYGTGVGNITNNLFNKDNIDKKNWYLNNGVPTSSPSFRCFVLECEPLTEYTLQRLNNTSLASPIGISFFEEYPVIGATPTNYYRYAKNEITLSSKENSKYIVCEYFYTGSSSSEENVINGMVLSKGKGVENYEPFGKYRVDIKVTNEKSESQTYSMLLDAPLKDGEYIDFNSAKVIRNDGKEEYIDLPELPSHEDYTKIEVLTEIAPSKIELEYKGYTIE